MIDLTILSNYGLIGVFITTFLSYSIIPLPSEFIIIGVSLIQNPVYVFIVALIGSTLGSITTYYIGFKGVRNLVPKKESKTLKKAEMMFDKYGHLSILFFSWLPFIGDPLILLAGSLKMNFWKFLTYSTIVRAVYLFIVIWFGVSAEGIF